MSDQIIREAIEAEIIRIIRVADAGMINTYRHDLIRPYGYAIIASAHPEITPDRWQEITGRRPDLSRDPAVARENARQHIEDRRLLREHGRPVCCAACDGNNAERLRRELEGPIEIRRDVGADEWALRAVPEAPQGPQERTCACDACDDVTCQGECDQCQYHGCSQCYDPDDHYASGCCGWCDACNDHGGDDRESVCDWGYCHECEHYCDR